MIRAFTLADGRLRPVADLAATPEAAVWIDLLAPDDEEEALVERLLGIDVPTLEEMVEIEDSSRLYHVDGAAFVTATLPVRAGAGRPTATPVTFILAGARLVTVRYDTPRAFETFPLRAERLDLGCADGETVLLALLDAVIERLADLLEETGRRIEGVAAEVFDGGADSARQGYRGVLQAVGAEANMISHVLASLVTLERAIAFLAAARAGKETRARLKSLSRDARFLNEHTTFLSQKINFLLDATLGMISIQQNAIIKIFSVAAVIFLPPTLVASIYGMNFDVIPELHWAFGYPIALGLMVASAVGSYWIFKLRGWL
ncbi:magnesium transporter CorA family protein [Amaricoccus sp.]|uniref:magnesium transporter CorA family protein n=1 Tax=Amaricoccus sp. TaxID=1872485 RepID=UPI001B610B16|nr:magnesium transporter CorA family protein [Amaricoccus sp.]MBP7241102.1 magnesium transporter CorA family protein [Amaricoccus sp.]